MTPIQQTAEDLTTLIVNAIEGWDDRELEVSIVNDGDCRFDFTGYRVRPEGRADLLKLLSDGKIMSEWRPIETAPMNGTPVLLAFDKPLHSNVIDKYVPFTELPCCMGWWDVDGWVLPFIEDGTADTEGFSSTFYMGKISQLPVKPTHWQPMPAAPVNQPQPKPEPA